MVIIKPRNEKICHSERSKRNNNTPVKQSKLFWGIISKIIKSHTNQNQLWSFCLRFRFCFQAPRWETHLCWFDLVSLRQSTFCSQLHIRYEVKHMHDGVKVAASWSVMMHNFTGRQLLLKAAEHFGRESVQRRCQTFNGLLYYCLEQEATINLGLLSFTVCGWRCCGDGHQRNERRKEFVLDELL